jgi:DNA-binding NtrC family response regulator
MGPDLSHVTSPGRFPRLLIVENNFSTTEPLIRAFGDRRLDVDFDACTTHGTAVRKLLAAPYQLIISGAHSAEIDDFLLLKRAQELQPFVPFVVTASASEKERARRVLERGALDLMLSLLDHGQTVRTIRLALWHGKLRNLIARKEAALEQYRQHMADYPDDRNKVDESFHKAMLAFEKTISSVARTILRVEESRVCFSDFARKVEYHVRKGALERLTALSQ